MEERIKQLESQVSKLTLVIENLQSQLNLKADKDKLHDLLGDKELSVELDGKGISDNVYKSVRSEHMYIRPKEGGEIRFT